MSDVRRWWGGAVATLAFVVSLPALAHAQKTDVVTLGNGDRITGEIKRLERGQLEFSTDDAGTLYLEWDKLASLVATRFVEVERADGTRYLGSLGPAAPRSIAVVGIDNTVTLDMSSVTLITPIGRSFWAKLDGSIDAGFSYTKSSGIAQLNLNSDTVYRRPGFVARLTGSFTQTQQEDASTDDRGAIEASYIRYPWRKWFLGIVSRFETNESLGLDLRSQIAGAVGPRLINSNRAQMGAGAGLAFNEERGVDVEPTQNLEALFLFNWSYFTYDRPKTNIDLTTQYYPSLSNPGRQRLQFDASVKREVLKDFFVALTLYDTFDSRPPNPDAERNDVGIVASLGWTY